MSVNGDFDYLLPPSRRRTATNGSTAGRDDDDKLVPLLESYSSLTSSMTSNSDTVYAPGFSYISTDMTAEAIRQCEKFILTPYANALKIIGWLPYRNSIGGYIWQGILVTMWIFCIIATMVTQILSCFKRDAFVPGKSVSESTVMPSITTSPPSFYDEDFDLGSNDTTFAPFPISPSNKIITCEQHIISSLILLDFVVIGAYFFGIYLFVRGETEYLFGLASHVFIKNSEAESSSKRLILTIGILFICGLVWLLFSLAVRIMTAIAVELFSDRIIIQWETLTLEGAVKISLLVFSLFGFFTFDMVYMFSIMNYVAQAEMNIYLLWDVRRLIEIRKYDHIDGGIKDVQKCKRYIDILNGKTATHTALSLFVLGILSLSSIIDIDRTDEVKSYLNESFHILAGVSSFLNVVCWTLLVSLPFIQAARVTYWCDKLKDLGPEIRGRVHAAYAEAPLLDLDSVLSFLHHIKLRAAIFGVPVSPWLLYLILVTFCFTMLVLFQVDAYSIATYI